MANNFVSPEVYEMATHAKSFGYSVITRHPRLWCLCPYEDVIYLAKHLKRRGWWALYRIDAMMWTTWGAMGKPVHDFIDQTKLMTFLYDEAYRQTKEHGGDVDKLKCSRPLVYKSRKGNIVDIKDIRDKKYRADKLEGKVINRFERCRKRTK